MRILLDESLPRQLAEELAGHEVRTVGQSGWAGVRNSELLRLASREFDVLVTIDQRMERENPIPPTLAILTLGASSNAIESLRPLVGNILETLVTLKPGEATRIRLDD